MKPLYFVSDLHLGREGDAERRTRFFRFLARIREQAGALYILGDLFEFGFEYRNGLLEENARIAQELSSLSAAGVKVSLIKGNHDCWLGPRFAQDYGIELHDSPLVTVVEGRKCYLAHGDELDPSLRNQLSRRLFRSRAATLLYSILPRRFGASLAGYLAGISRETGYREELSQILESFAADRIGEGYDIVVLAHVHLTRLKPIGAGWYLNPGDWLSSSSYGRWDDSGLRLGAFDSGST